MILLQAKQPNLVSTMYTKILSRLITKKIAVQWNKRITSERGNALILFARNIGAESKQ